MSAVTVDARGSIVRFKVRVQPRASRNEIVGVIDGALRIRLRAPPVDGAANEALVAFLAERLAVKRRGVRIATGESSRTKTIEVEGISASDVERLVAESPEARKQ